MKHHGCPPHAQVILPVFSWFQQQNLLVSEYMSFSHRNVELNGNIYHNLEKCMWYLVIIFTDPQENKYYGE